MLCYSIDIARAFADDAHICVSSDSAEIIAVAEKYGLSVPFTRPTPIAGDLSPTREAILHALDHYRAQGIDYETVVLLQPTSPFRKAEDISKALDLYDPSIDMVVSVKETKSNPYYLLYEEDPKGFLQKSKMGNFSSRQTCPKVWELNGSVYVINARSIRASEIAGFTKVKKSEMDSVRSVDLDTETDWAWAEFLIERKLV